jgi:hypothetical protein
MWTGYVKSYKLSLSFIRRCAEQNPAYSEPQHSLARAISVLLECQRVCQLVERFVVALPLEYEAV